MTAPQAAKTDTPLYPLGQDKFLVEIHANGKTLTHYLRRPTLAELVEREQQSVYETEEVDGGQDAIRIEDEKANANLWNKIVVTVCGYKTATHKPDETIDVTPELAEKIPASHKATAVRGLYTFTAEVEAGEDDGFNLDGEIFVVKQVFGDEDDPAYVIRHHLRQPTESERQEYKRRVSQTLFSRGTKRTRARVVTNLKAAVELYDRLFQHLEGAEGDGPIDPIWKRQAVAALMGSFESSLSD